MKDSKEKLLQVAQYSLRVLRDRHCDISDQSRAELITSALSALEHALDTPRESEDWTAWLAHTKKVIAQIFEAISRFYETR